MSLANYIPHQAPMRLVDTLLSSSPLEVEVEAHILADNIFYDASRGGVPAWTGIEYMAQAAAVWVGIEDTRLSKPIEPAFLISSRQYTAHCPLFALGEPLRIRVHADLVDGPLVAFRGTIHNRTGLLAEAIFTAYRPDDIAAYMAATEPQTLSAASPLSQSKKTQGVTP
ncbi:hypothetical protein [uncultured Gilvimarinus sp.]|uniref:ApeP family dehydratase n=1 Tax=uncultured Gilvimarinus sp. TaxID=1689143 RepID=UPI0030DAA6B8